MVGDLESRFSCDFPEGDIGKFAMLMFDVNRGNPVHNNLCGLGSYGSNLEQVSAAFRAHFNKCYGCNERFTDELESWEAPLKGNFSADPQQNAAWKRGNELHRWFLLEHQDIPERNELQRYVAGYHKKNKVNPEFEKHIKACSSCTEYVAVQEKFRK